MALLGEARVIPSGKVYRQIFDDEVQLVHALGEARSKKLQRKGSPSSGKIPLVRDKCSGNRFLSQRQQMWVEGMPNDEVTENPVLFRLATILEQQKAKESENVIAAREVRGLADDIIPKKKNSDVIERISENRRRLYDTALTNCRQEISCIGKDMERYILEPAESFWSKLSESDRIIESLFIRAKEDSDLETFTAQDFEEVWELISQQTSQRRQWIRELDEELHKAEWRRTELLKVVLKKYAKILEDSAYLLSYDVHRFIHAEAMIINQALLVNRRAIGRLYINLMEADLKREVIQRNRLDERLKTWKAMQKKAIVSSFREFMESDRIQNPRAVKAEMENMLKEQLLLQEQRTALLFTLSNFLPLSSPSKAEINEWNATLVALNKRIDTSNVQHMMRIRIQYEKVCQECLSKVQEYKQKLVEMKVCTEKEAERVVNPSFFQLVGKLQTRFEDEMEKMDNDFEHLMKHTEINCRHLYQYFQDALFLFDAHHRKLVHQEDDLHHKMNDLRNKHESLNKVRESNLDMSVDKLRIQSSEDRLKSQLDKIYNALDLIRAGYDHFHHDLLARVNLYPELILHELLSYSTSISRYFHVKPIYRGKPFTKPPVIVITETTEDAEEEVEGSEESMDSIPEQGSEEGELQQKQEEEMDETAKVEEEEDAELEIGVTDMESEVFGITSDMALDSDMDKSETESFIMQDVGDVPEIEETMTMLSERTESTVKSETGMEYFTTLSGNTYKAASFVKKSKTKKSEKYYVGKLNEETLPIHLEQVYLSHSFLTNMRRQIRQQFFEHLEKWFAQTLSRAWVIVASEKEELKSELHLRIHLHEPRRERIEKDIFRVRMAELRLHKERLVRHCAGIVQALNKERASFLKIREDQNSVSKAFQQRIQDMENTFLVEGRADKLLSLSTNLHGELVNHMEVMQISLRSYRQYLEESLGKLRDANTDYLKACKLFSDGGNFSPEEVEHMVKALEKEGERIDFVEGLIMIDLEKMESAYLEQATEVINKFENKFRHLALDRVFMEKLQRFLTNVQVKIKSEVANSNFQTKTLNSHLEKLIHKIDACTYPTVDKESISPDELLELAMFVIEELKKRTTYLDCLLTVETTLSLPEAVVSQESRGSYSVVLSDNYTPEAKVIVMGMESTPLMNPCRIGKSALEDAVLALIRNLLGIYRYKKTDQQIDKDEGAGTTAPEPSFGSLQRDNIPQGANVHGMLPSMKVSSSLTKGASGSIVSIQRYTKLTKVEKKAQVLGNRLKENDFFNFKGIIFRIVWDSFDILMVVAEEFYKKDKHQITRPDLLQETFDQCIENMGMKLLAYVSQTDDYHSACVSEFRDQLKRFEGLLPSIAKLVIGKHLKDYEQHLMDSMGQIRRNLQEEMRKWDLAKDKNKNQLCPSMGHPDNIPQLDALCQVEEERQKEQEEGIYQGTHQLQVCLIDWTQKFVFALASCTEKILLKLDNCLTIDDIQLGKIEVLREKTSTLIRRKRAGLSLEVEASKMMAERGSRTWPGIPKTMLTGLPNQTVCRETPAVNTTKTTLGHLAAVEERDAVYVKFKQMIEAEFAKVTEERTVQLQKAQHWADWWWKSVQKIKRLYV